MTSWSVVSTVPSTQGMDADEERAYLKRCADEQRAKKRKLARVYSQDDEPRIASNNEAQENQY